MKRIAGVATIPGREKALEEMLASIEPQVDDVVVYRNGTYGEWPADAGKFVGLERDCVYFSLDDDIIYPDNFCERWIAALEKYTEIYGRALITSHGKVYQYPTHSYYHGFTHSFAGLHEVIEDVVVHVPGSGSSCFYANDILGRFNNGIDLLEITRPEQNMADLYLAQRAKMYGVTCVVIAHKAGWLVHSPHVEMTQTIYSREHRNEARQTQIVNELLCDWES